MINMAAVKRVITILYADGVDVHSVCAGAIVDSEVLTEIQKVAILGRMDSIFSGVSPTHPGRAANRLLEEVAQIGANGWADLGIIGGPIEPIAVESRMAVIVQPMVDALRDELENVASWLLAFVDDDANFVEEEPPIEKPPAEPPIEEEPPA